MWPSRSLDVRMEKDRRKCGSHKDTRGSLNQLEVIPGGPSTDRYARAQEPSGTDGHTATRPLPTQKEARPHPGWLHVYKESRTPCTSLLHPSLALCLEELTSSETRAVSCLSTNACRHSSDATWTSGSRHGTAC